MVKVLEQDGTLPVDEDVQCPLFNENTAGK